MSAQTVFSALDYLNRWARAKAYRLAIKTHLVTAKHRKSPSLSGTCTSQAFWCLTINFIEHKEFRQCFSIIYDPNRVYLCGQKDIFHRYVSFGLIYLHIHTTEIVINVTSLLIPSLGIPFVKIYFPKHNLIARCVQ